MSTSAGTSDRDSPASRLAPLPRRTLEEEQADGGILTASPTASVADLLERVNQLLFQLQADIDALKHDQERDQKRIQDEAEQRQRDAERAIALLQQLHDDATDIAKRKAAAEPLATGLATPMAIDRSVTFDHLLRRTEEELRLARGITGAIRLADIGKLLKQAALHVSDMSDQAESARQDLIRETEKELSSEGKEARASYEIGMGVVMRDLRVLDLALPPSGLPWDDERWQRWDNWDPLSGASRWIRYGSFYRPKLEKIRFPALIEVPGDRPLAFDVASGDRDVAIGAVRSILARALASATGGDVRLSLVDPIGLGDSVAPFLPLREYRDDLVGTKVATAESEIEDHLAELGRHIETVIAQHLRGGFESLDEASDHAGELLEPYRILAVFDFPKNFTPRSHELLRNILENGPRCGVLTVATTTPGAARASGSKWRGLLLPFTVVRGTPEGYLHDAGPAGEWSVELDTLPETTLTDSTGQATLLGRIVATTGSAARQGRQIEVGHARSFDLLANARRTLARDDLPDLARDVRYDDPATWWVGDSTRGLGTPIGKTSTREVATLWLDSHTSPGLIIGGDEGTGATTLLNSVVTGLSILYPPDELALYLLDFTPDAGSFASYAEEALPHAKVVAYDADRDFGVSVLDALTREMTRRAMIVSPHGGERAGIDGYRRDTGEDLARIVTVIDGADHLFGRDDRITEHAIQALDLLARQGPSYGIHLVLATHDMAVLQRLGRHTTDQISRRIAFACPEAESRRVLGGDGGASALEGPGEALSRTIGDAEPVRALHTSTLTARDRDVILRGLRARATREGRGARPFVFEGSAPARIEDGSVLVLATNADAQHPRLQPRLWLGEPMTLGPALEITLRRAPTSNLLVVGGTQARADGLVFATVATAALGHGDDITINVVDFSPLESGFTEACTVLGAHFPVTVSRRHALAENLDRVRRTVKERVRGGEFGARPVILVLNAIGAADELDVATGGPREGGGEKDPMQVLEQITRDGPAVGVHVVVSSDSARTVVDRLSRASLRNFSFRAALPLPSNDSLTVIDSAAASSLRDHQGLLYDESMGTLTKFRPYTLPSASAVERIARAAFGRDEPRRAAAPAEEPKPEEPASGEPAPGEPEAQEPEAAQSVDSVDGEPSVDPEVAMLEHSSKTTPKGAPTSALAPNAR